MATVTFKTGEELKRGAMTVGTVMAQEMKAGESAFILGAEEFGAELRDQELIEREIAAHTGVYSEADAQRIVVEVLAKCESEYVRRADPRLALNHLANWR